MRWPTGCSDWLYCGEVPIRAMLAKTGPMHLGCHSVSTPSRFHAPRLVLFAPLAALLVGCLVTPTQILVPPLPSLHSEKSFDLYYLQGPLPAGDGKQSGIAHLCTISSDMDWIDGEFRTGGHEEACDAGRKQPYPFRYERGLWQFGGLSKDRLPEAAAASAAGDDIATRHYVLCAKSGRRLETLGTTLNSGSGRLELKDRGCKAYLPPLEQGFDLYFIDARVGVIPGMQAARLCGSRQEVKAFDFGFRQGGHGYACSDQALASGDYRFMHVEGLWLLQGSVNASAQPVPETAAGLPETATRRYVICKRVGKSPGTQPAISDDRRMVPAMSETSCRAYLPPALESPRKR